MGGERASKKRPAAAVAEAPDEDEAFPRGGGDRLLTPLQKRQLTAQANEDFEAEQKSGKKQKKGKGSGGKVGRCPPPPPQPPRRCRGGRRRRPRLRCSRLGRAAEQNITACQQMPPAACCGVCGPAASTTAQTRAPPPPLALQDADGTFLAGGDLATKQERFVELLKYKVRGAGAGAVQAGRGPESSSG
jgi:hypothetical protein